MAKNNASRNGPANKKKLFFRILKNPSCDQPLAKEPEDSGYDIGLEIWSCRPTSVENSWNLYGIEIV